MASCQGCGAPVAFVTVLKQAGGTARMILNHQPDPGGNVAVRATHTGGRIGRVLPKGTLPAPGEVLFMPHWASCPTPPPRKPKPPARAKPKPQPATLFGEGGVT